MSNALQQIPPLIRKKETRILYHIKRNTELYLMAMVPLLVYILFKYVPIFGVIIAFQEYDPFSGLLKSKWVGFAHFESFITGPYFLRLMRNTLLINIYQLVFSFPAPIVLALLLNELKALKFKRVIQSISYLPHFISTVIVVGMMMKFLGSEGIVNIVLNKLGLRSVIFFSELGWFRPLYVGSGIWQGIGWGSIVYLATLAGINPELYEAAVIDGANRWHRVIYITIPALVPTIVILLLLKIGDMLDVGFEKVYLMYNPGIYETSDVIATYVFRRGIEQLNYSFATAVGLFKAVFALLLMYGSNRLARRVTGTSLW